MSNPLSFFNYDSFRLYTNEYYDFTLSSGDVEICKVDNSPIIDKSIVNIDFSNEDSISGNTIISTNLWSGATNNGVSNNFIGLVGLDNGLLTYTNTGDTSNTDLVNILTGSNLTILSSDTRFFMNRVTGSTNNIIYPTNFIYDNDFGTVLNLCGGFYQGFYKIEGEEHEVLPNRVNKAMVLNFRIKPTELNCQLTGNTLNDLYPNNKGIFFYMGTRAENKFWNYFEGLNTGCTSGCTVISGCTDILTDFCTIPKENNVNLTINNIDIPLYPNNINPITTDNKFLIFGRSNNEILANKNTFNYSGESVTFSPKINNFNRDINPFLLFNRGRDSHCKTGSTPFTVCDVDDLNIRVDNKEYRDDVIDNSFALIYKDDGSIGYRYYTYDCDLKDYTIKEEYTTSGLVKADEWSNISVRFIYDKFLSDDELVCDNKARNGKILIYVNCKLKHVFRNFKEIIPRKLNEINEKQVTVPFNISLGGGTQGLLENMTFDGQDLNDLGLVLEQNFAGTFIGQIESFNIFNKDITWCGIKDFCSDNDYLIDELNNFINTDNINKIKI